MTISRDEFIRLVNEKDWKKLKGCKLSGLDAKGLDFSSSGLDYGLFSLLDLTGANFEGCTFGEADFSCACLRDACFSNTMLEGANLSQTDCRGADFSFARLQFANLSDMDLEGAIFRGADISGAYLVGSFLVGVDFEGAILDDQVYLPDDESVWSQDADLARFTDPNHPNFWINPDWLPGTVEELKRKYRK